MSEYQYYEFQALDRALDREEQAELRAVSSRAAIGPRRFTNEYHWGDFKGNPVEWMKRYFDAHLYLSNFGSRALHLRLPLALVDREAIRPYEVKYVLEARTTRTHLVLSFHSDEEPGRDYDEFDGNPSGALGRLLPVRDLLARGDLRPLYLVWLLAVQNREIDDDTPEPPVPPGLGQRDGVLGDLANFLWLDPELVEVAACGSGTMGERVSDERIQTWLAGLSEKEKDHWLLRLVSEEGQVAALELRKAFAATMKTDAVSSGSSQKAGELLSAAEELATQRREAAARKAATEKAAREKKKQEERLAFLRSLQGTEPKLWKSVIELTETSIQSNYDTAVKRLVDLRDLALLTGESIAFFEKLEGLRELRRRKSSLLARLDKAGLKP